MEDIGNIVNNIEIQGDSDPKLLGIFLSEFHDRVGKQIVAQKFYPSKEITKQEYDNISEFIVPKDELCGKLILAEFREDYYVIGLPTILKNTKEKIYKREKFIFTISLILSKEIFRKNPYVCQEITRKIAHFFASIEMDYNIIYFNKKEEITNMLSQIFVQINSDTKECFIEYNSQHYMFFKLIDQVDYKNQITKICEHEVPIPNIRPEIMEKTMKEYNSTLFKVYQEIDGQKCVRKISDDLKMDLKQLNVYLLNLLELKIIYMVDIFKFSNQYALTPLFHQFMKNPMHKQACLEYIVKDEYSTKEANIDDAISLYLQLQQGKNLDYLIGITKNRQKLLKFNLVEFIHFGLINKIIRRVYEYPVIVRERIFDIEDLKGSTLLSEKSPDEITKEDVKKLNLEIVEMVRNGCCLDEILIHFQITKDVFQRGDQNKHNINFIIYK